MNRTCLNCGCVYSESLKFCPFCGAYSIDEETSIQALSGEVRGIKELPFDPFPKGNAKSHLSSISSRQAEDVMTRASGSKTEIVEPVFDATNKAALDLAEDSGVESSLIEKSDKNEKSLVEIIIKSPVEESKPAVKVVAMDQTKENCKIVPAVKAPTVAKASDKKAEKKGTSEDEATDKEEASDKAINALDIKKLDESSFNPDLIPEKYRPTSTSGFVGYLLLFSIPLVGFICLLVFAFGSGSRQDLKNLSRAMLIWQLIAFVIVFVFYGSALYNLYYLSRYMF